MRKVFMRTVLLCGVVLLVWICGLYGYAFLRNLIRPDDFTTVSKIEMEAIQKRSLVPAVWVDIPVSSEEQNRFNNELNRITALQKTQPKLADELWEKLNRETKMGGRYYPVWAVPLFVSEGEAWLAPVVMAPASLVADPVETITRKPWAVFLAALIGTVISVGLWRLGYTFRIRRLCKIE